MPKLPGQARSLLRTRNYSLRTEEAYIYWIKSFILFHNKRHPTSMGAPEVRAFLSHRNCAPATQQQATSALLFLYRDVLDLTLDWSGHIDRAKKPTRVPQVFTRAEAQAVLLHLKADKWLMASLLYEAGLRLMECLRLRVKDLDFGYRQIAVRDGKGARTV